MSESSDTQVSEDNKSTETTAEDTAKIVLVLGNDTFENPGAAITSVTNGANGVTAKPEERPVDGPEPDAIITNLSELRALIGHALAA